MSSIPESEPRRISPYANSLVELKRYQEAKAVLRKMMPVARRVLGDSNETTIRMRWHYARALFSDTSATLADLREAVTTLEDIERIARRVLGGAHPMTKEIGDHLRLMQRSAPERSAAP